MTNKPDSEKVPDRFAWSHRRTARRWQRLALQLPARCSAFDRVSVEVAAGIVSQDIVKRSGQ